MKPIIRVEHLSKQYRLGAQQASYATLRESLTNAVKTPLRWFGTSHSSHRTRHSESHFWALDDVSFDVMPGEVVGIIGRNGAGKSTLLKVLSRITEPTRGQVKLYGRVGSLLEVGTGFHAELSGRENIYLNGAILGMKRHEIESKFDEIVAFAEIEQFLDTPVKHYSSGMYMRLAFSVAAHLDPEILVIDEVLAVGDAEFQKKCLSKMGDVAKAGRTVLFVSHNMNAIEQLCSTALMLEKGVLKKIGKNVRDLIRDYLFTDSAGDADEWVNSERHAKNEWVEPLRFAVSDENGRKLPKPVSNNSEICLTIEAEFHKLDPALTIGYAIYSEDGNLLYWSYQTDRNESQWPEIKRGICVLKTNLPKRLFNEGTYRIELIASLHFRKWLFQPGVNAPTIYLTIQGGLSDSPLWMVKRPGLLAPVFGWEISYDK